MEKRLLTAEEVAQTLGIGRTKVYELIAGGQLASIKIGARRLVPTTKVDDFIALLSGTDEAA